jgi:hypothetical protein
MPQLQANFRAVPAPRPAADARSLSQRLLLLALLCLGFAAALEAQTAASATEQGARELLNSERIEQRFGSYGIDVLESGRAIRVSNLYSLTGQQKICRTFAVVRYPDRIDPSFAVEHGTILDGGSIGAVFAARGWTVRKSHRHYGNVAASAKLQSLMGGLQSAELALHLYVLEVAKDGVAFDYAVIAEVHHPDYLVLQDLYDIYGDELDDTDPDLVDSMLRVTERKMR